MRPTYRPLTFFSLSLLIPWLLWFTAAYISHHQPSKAMLYIQIGLGIAGLITPMLMALWLRYEAIPTCVPTQPTGC